MASLNAITVPTTSDNVATCAESSLRSHFVDKTHNFLNTIEQLHCSQERDIFFPSSLTGDVQFAKTSNAAASSWGCYCSSQCASLCPKKYVFYVSARRIVLSYFSLKGNFRILQPRPNFLMFLLSDNIF